MEAKFSPRVKDVLSFSREEAVRLGNDFISVEHLLLGAIREGEGKAITFLNRLGINLAMVRKDIESELSKMAILSPNNINVKANIPLVKQAEKVLKFMYLEAKVYQSTQIGTEHLLLSMLKIEDCFACKILNKYGVIYDNIAKYMENS
ncbi:MAG TPA: Clp protease N-terminal domain-containing protein, partial [Crocinitomicaceae bacterium]|nr:Clp protease N-terminal domain-containing protein [Crocinitomicaceae bacterium]